MIRFLLLVPLVFILVYVSIIVGLLVFCIINKKWRKRENFRRIAMMAITALVLSRPVFVNGYADTLNSNLVLFFVVDSSGSMATKDQNGGAKYRYEQVIDDVKELISTFPGSHYSVITTDVSIYTALPITTNTDSALAAADILIPKDSLYSSSSDLSGLLNYAEKRLLSFSEKNPGLKKIVFFFSDGENNANSILSINKSVDEHITSGAVFGYGSEDGGAVMTIRRITNSKVGGSENRKIGTYVSDQCLKAYYGLGSVTTDSNGCVVSRMDTDTLRRIADGLGVKYYYRNNEKLPEELLNNIRKEISLSGSKSTEGYVDLYWIFMIILLGLLIWDFYDSLNKVLLERSMKHA